jgi:hypothetical protein
MSTDDTFEAMLMMLTGDPFSVRIIVDDRRRDLSEDAGHAGLRRNSPRSLLRRSIGLWLVRLGTRLVDPERSRSGPQ